VGQIQKEHQRDWRWEVTRNRFLNNKSPHTNLVSFHKVTVFVAQKNAQILYTLTNKKVFDIVSHNVLLRKSGEYDQFKLV